MVGMLSENFFLVSLPPQQLVYTDKMMNEIHDFRQLFVVFVEFPGSSRT